MPALRNLVIVLGDQLDLDSKALAGFDPAQDLILMAEVREESERGWSHKARIALFLSAMRHFAQAVRERGWPLEYRALEDHGFSGLAEVWQDALARHSPKTLVVTEPGDWRVEQSLKSVCAATGIPLQIRPDDHFLIDRPAFKQWADAYRGSLRMEFFYRFMRKRENVLLSPSGQPVGGKWNFDQENRKGFGKRGPRDVPEPPSFSPDSITRDVFSLVERCFPEHPGSLDYFHWPVTRDEARLALREFIERRLSGFGPHQDAMWTGMPFGWHSLLSAALNLKLLNPREVIDEAEAACARGDAELASAEGFIRQILGWREFMRGVYWRDMPSMLMANGFDHQRPLPRWYWTGAVAARCLHATVQQTLSYGYAHHIQRLMVTGLFGLLAEIRPAELNDWYLGSYVDAIDWVVRPNTTGMALYADGGRFTSKPYLASGAYIQRMSNYCKGCRYDPGVKTGPRACPFTLLYWRFLIQKRARLSEVPRLALAVRNVDRLSRQEQSAVIAESDAMLDQTDSI
jgi:deoxyribodipyrimidine photolyase-related protein